MGNPIEFGRGREVEHVLTGRDLWIYDDFLGGSVDLSKWAFVAGTATTGSDPPAAGVLDLQVSAGNSYLFDNAATLPMLAGTNFRMRLRFRVPGYAAAVADTIDLKMDALAGGTDLGFRVTRTGIATSNLLATHLGTTTDLGIAVPVANHLDVELIRQDGICYWMVEGQLLWQQANATAFPLGKFLILNANGATGLQVFVDYVKVWIERGGSPF